LKKQILFIAIIIAVLLTSFWEWHWRAAGYRPYHDDSNDLWAIWRRQVPDLKEDEVLIIGSSRAHFDLNIYEWEKLTGSRPIMLASGGMSPAPLLKELAENTDFKSILFVGVAPDLFFGTEKDGGWRRKQERMDFAKKETYAQRLNQSIFMQIDPHFAYINENLQLKGLVEWLPVPQRDSVHPPMFWPDMSVSDANRNLEMIPEMESDTVMQNAYKKIWASWGWEKPDSTKRDTVINNYATWAKTIEGRGGKVIFFRAPATGTYRDYENEAFPREKYWDVLLERSACKGVHFEDYPQLNTFVCPEWSHLLAKDAKVFTQEFVKILQAQGQLKTAN